MRLTLDFLLTLLIEVPVIAFFFIRKERERAMLLALIINFISWPIMQTVIFITDFDFINYSNKALLAGTFFIFEAIAYQYFLETSFKKSFLMAFFANLLSFGMGLLLQYLFRHTNTSVPIKVTASPAFILPF